MKKSSSKFPNENQEIYSTNKLSIKDLYIVLLITLVSLIVLFTPINRYISTISYLNINIEFFIIIFNFLLFLDCCVPYNQG